MKTNIFSSKNSLIYTVIGFVTVLFSSCGSYQNSSYYDNDGIYGATPVSSNERQYQEIPNDANPTTNYYKNYFSSLQDGDQSSEIFTDIDNYANYNEDSTQVVTSSNYAGWGNNYSGTTIQINSNPYNYGFYSGFNSPYYGYGYNNFGWNNYGWNNFGWNNPYYGYSYLNFGWYNPYYSNFYNPYYYNYYNSNGHYYNNRNYSYNSSRRGSSRNDNINSNRNYSSYRVSSDRNSNNSDRTSRNGFSTRRDSRDIDFRRTSQSSNRITNPDYNRGSRSQNSSYSRPIRSNTETNNTRRQVAPTRSSTPPSTTNSSRSENYSRSSSSSSSSSMGRSSSSGSSSGGRSSSGGSSRRGGN